MKAWLGGRRFADNEELQATVRVYQELTGGRLLRGGYRKACLSLRQVPQTFLTVDRDAIAQLEWKVEDVASVGERGLQLASSALLHTGRHGEARKYVERLLRLSPSSGAAMVVSGWLEMAERNTRAAARLFKTALGQDKSNVDAILGELASLSPADGLQLANQLIVRYPRSTPPLAEKMRLLLAMKDWTQTLDTASRLLTLEPDNLAALEVRAVHQLAVAGDYAEAAVAVRRHTAAAEAQGADLLWPAQLYSRLCGRNTTILTETIRLATQATQLKPHDTKSLLELATQHRLAGRLAEANKAYRTVTRLDGTCTAALCGLTLVQLAQTGLTQQVTQQVEFLVEVMGTQPSPELLMLRCQCERDWGLLDRAVTLLTAPASHLAYGSKYLACLNPDLLMEIADLYPDTVEGLARRVVVLRQVVDQCGGLAGAVLGLARALTASGDLGAATQLLARVDPTNTDAHLVLAQIHLAQDKYEEANASLELGLSYNLQVRERPLYHVLLGAIQRHHGDTQACAQSMRTALSLNKGEQPLTVSELGTLYLELVASLTAGGNTKEAAQALAEGTKALEGTEQESRLTVARGELAAVSGDYTAALTLLATVQPGEPYFLQSSFSSHSSGWLATGGHRAGELAAVSGDYTAALTLLATVQPGEPYFLQSSFSSHSSGWLATGGHRAGELAAVSGDYTAALTLLATVQPGEPYFLQSSFSSHSSGWLATGGHRAGELAAVSGDYTAALTLLATVQPGEPYFLQSSFSSHSSGWLATGGHRAGELAAVSGDYTAALTLLATVQPGEPYFLQARKKMAEIHLHKLKDERAFAECYKQLVTSKPSTENLLLLGDAYMAIQEPELAVETYERAMKSSSSDPKLSARLGRVLVKCHQYGKAIKCLRDAGAEGSLELAQLLVRLGQLEAAENALTEVPLSDKAFILAKVREKSGDIQGAMMVLREAREGLGPAEVGLNARMCAQLAEYASTLREHDSAIGFYKRALQYQPGDAHMEIALAKLYMQVNDWSSCQNVCSTLLSRDPDNEPALLMLADLAYRRVDLPAAATHFSTLLARHPTYWVALARLVEVYRRTAQLSQAQPFLQAAAALAPGHPGLSYCTGLYEWYVGNVNAALHHFNSARGDSEWGQQALHNMVELCLAGDSGDGASVSTGTRLLSQMSPHTADEESNVRLLQNFVLLASKDKQDVDLAISDLTTLASQENLRVGATLGLANGYVQQKQTARARNLLKRVASAAWLVEEAEHLERCWLLLADLHIQAGRHDAATELLRRALQHNQSCHRAYQLLGLIAEKDQKYLEASVQYRHAWKLSGENDPALGFKLAFNQVKAKRYADAIGTCQAVLKLNPDYPRIRKEILDKAVSHLRT
ncbi:LOW QUALITY PROTEIN: tetratricopeptide repeat protein 21B-like [Homalodisca vitripennis]|uniref:LOW QUALITY PROTEIN: tetratricopeptide repeat protein 21B-like n=1 Tax=Homalodisca vitripennis TaxID=197043 RepID=UPI001EEA7F97|nr:LOW QUALITY PROTEIN: tetratricopeptide repeat protein 21B-like [Homalodisca vitripennis]